MFDSVYPTYPYCPVPKDKTFPLEVRRRECATRTSPPPAATCTMRIPYPIPPTSGLGNFSSSLLPCPSCPLFPTPHDAKSVPLHTKSHEQQPAYYNRIRLSFTTTTRTHARATCATFMPVTSSSAQGVFRRRRNKAAIDKSGGQSFGFFVFFSKSHW